MKTVKIIVVLITMELPPNLANQHELLKELQNRERRCVFVIVNLSFN